ncbi:P-loop NTPase family protein [Paenibacillus pini]|uniref:Uncharacterized protein n=1 Tax=Paenibacillus pini JCM 16418 TaxID=1236976 RepID=W7YN17_9BACL|nr:hypothetical protein [Paenibacillus pini]GAF09857.1 hypothetical protein JCM16418_4016 [Paenibacillus pini JCM 16418]
MKKFEIGKTYDAVVQGEIWSFEYEGIDEDEEDVYIITWMSGECEGLHKSKIEPLVEEAEVLKAAGVIYPRGRSEEEQYKAICLLIEQPTYFFVGEEVPKAVVLSDHYAPGGYKGEKDYLGITYDKAQRMIVVTSRVPDITLPNWIIEKFDVVGTMKIKDKDKIVWQINLK